MNKVKISVLVFVAMLLSININATAKDLNMTTVKAITGVNLDLGDTYEQVVFWMEQHNYEGEEELIDNEDGDQVLQIVLLLPENYQKAYGCVIRFDTENRIKRIIAVFNANYFKPPINIQKLINTIKREANWKKEDVNSVFGIFDNCLITILDSQDNNGRPTIGILLSSPKQ